VVQVERDTWCYTHSSRGVERADVELGRNNDKFVQVVKGLDPGNRIVLNPMLIFEESKGDNNNISPDSGAPEAPDIPEATTVAETAPAAGAEMADRRPGGVPRVAPPQGPRGGPPAAAGARQARGPARPGASAPSTPTAGPRPAPQ
jgi:hypothetical protein